MEALGFEAARSQLVTCGLSPGPGYDGERAASDSFGTGEWEDLKVRHTFIRKVRSGLGGRVPGPWAVVGAGAVGVGGVGGVGEGQCALSARGNRSHGNGCCLPGPL